MALASASQWLFNFTLSKITPTMVTSLGWKLFMTFATINILGGCTFIFFLPETKGKSLEEMDIIFGAVSAEKREGDIVRAQRDMEVMEREEIEGIPASGSSRVNSMNEKVDPESHHVEKVV